MKNREVKLRGGGKTEVRKLGGKKKDNEEQEMCEMQEGDGESRVEINSGGKQTNGSGNTLHVC